MASEEDILSVDSSYETIDIIDLTKDSPKIRPLRSRPRHRNLSIMCNTRSSSNRNSHLNQRCAPLPPLTLGNTQDTEIENSTRTRKRACNLSINSTVNLDDTNEENDLHVNLTEHKDDDEKPSLKCPICFESLSSNLKPTTTRCGHIFCANCLETFIRASIKKKCPTCQSKITLKSCTRLYI